MIGGLIGLLLALGYAPKPPPRFGPVVMDMPLEQIVRAAPKASAASSPDGTLHRVTIPEVITIGKVAYSIKVELTADAYTLHLWGDAAARGDDLEDCRKPMTSLLHVLEKQFGPLSPLDVLNRNGIGSDMAGHPAWRIGASQIVSDRPSNDNQRTLSRSRGQVWRTPDGTRWYAGLRATPAQPFDVLAEAFAFDATAGYGPKTPTLCFTSVDIRHVLAPPAPPDVIDLRTRRLLTDVSLGVRSHSLDGVGALPAQGVVVVMDCLVSRATGQVIDCEAEDNDAYAAVAMARVKTIVFDHFDLDPADARPLYARIPVPLSQKDRLQVGEPGSDGFGDPVWLGPPPDVAKFYPSRAARMEKSGAATLYCQIQVDGSLVCPIYQLTQGPTGYGFEQSALEFALALQAGPTLKDGRPSAGVWVKVPVSFQLH